MKPSVVDQAAREGAGQTVAQAATGLAVAREGTLNEALKDVVQIVGTEGNTFEVTYVSTAQFLLPSEGTLSARLNVTLPKNAVVDDLQIKVTARRADQAQASLVAELRGAQNTEPDQYEIIVDFGTVRTVSTVSFSVDSYIHKVEAWNGTEFPVVSSSRAPYGETARSFLPGAAPDERLRRLRSDVRTERLRITVTSEEPLATLMDGLLLVLPDSPKDLSISIDGGPPVWNLSGPAAKGADAALSTDAWNTLNQRLVDLTDVFAGLTGDPLQNQDETFELVLTSREAGVLEIATHSSSYRRIRRAQFGGAFDTTLKFSEEGVTDLPLVAPGATSAAVADEVRMKVAGEFGPQRRIPATGPDTVPISSTDSDALADVTLTAERAIIVRLSTVAGLSSLTGLRLPLAAGPDGAEVRLIPWSNAGQGRLQPDAALDDLTGEPVSLEAGASGWASYPFGGPLELDPENLPWVAILVARGSVSAGLCGAGGGLIRVGPPSGPWRPMPTLFGQAQFADLRFPFRAMGDAEETGDPAPLSFEIAGSAAAPQSVEPVSGGASLTLDGIAKSSPALRITHLSTGEIDLDEVDILFDI